MTKSMHNDQTSADNTDPLSRVDGLSDEDNGINLATRYCITIKSRQKTNSYCTNNIMVKWLVD